jgi:hypothetical protein
MNAFERAMGVLVADRNMGVDAEYYVGPWNVRHPMRVIVSRPDQAAAGFQLSSVTETAIITVAVAGFPEQPVKGGFFDVGGDVYRVEQAERDETRAAWRCECKPC